MRPNPCCWAALAALVCLPAGARIDPKLEPQVAGSDSTPAATALSR